MKYIHNSQTFCEFCDSGFSFGSIYFEALTIRTGDIFRIDIKVPSTQSTKPKTFRVVHGKKFENKTDHGSRYVK